MSNKLKHNCGLCVAHTLHDAYSFIKALQHRGREAVGIAAIGEQRIDVIKWLGTINRFGIEDLHEIFPNDRNNYHSFMAHVRYATRGRKDKILEDAHPHVIGGVEKNRGDHVYISGCEMAAVHNGQVDKKYLTDVNSRLLKTGCDTEALMYLIRSKGEQYVLKNIPGAFTLAFADKRRGNITIIRDKKGMKPGVLGWKDGKHCVASEDSAISGGKFIENLKPGFAYYLSPSGEFWKESIAQDELRHCFFEWNYLANSNSRLEGINVIRIRELLGEALANEFRPDDANFVTFLPRCPEPAARVYSNLTEIPLIKVFYKMRNERSFQGSTSIERRISINNNLNILPEINGKSAREFLKGETIILIDDSTIRGTNSARARELLYTYAKVKKVYLANYTPKIGVIGEDNVARGCLFGVDMPPGDDFISIKSGRNSTLEEISRKIGMETIFLSKNGMLNAFEKVGLSRSNLCTYCIGGPHPFDNSE